MVVLCLATRCKYTQIFLFDIVCSEISLFFRLQIALTLMWRLYNINDGVFNMKTRVFVGGNVFLCKYCTLDVFRKLMCWLLMVWLVLLFLVRFFWRSRECFALSTRCIFGTIAMYFNLHPGVVGITPGTRYAYTRVFCQKDGHPFLKICHFFLKSAVLFLKKCHDF